MINAKTAPRIAVASRPTPAEIPTVAVSQMPAAAREVAFMTRLPRERGQ